MYVSKVKSNSGLTVFDLLDEEFNGLLRYGCVQVQV